RAQDIPVGALQGRAGEDCAAGMTQQFAAETMEPAGPVLVIQGQSLAHLFDVARGMELIAFDQGQPESLCDLATRGRLARAGNSHHHDMQGVHCAKPCSSMAMTSSAKAE